MAVLGVDPGLRFPAAAIVSTEGKLVSAATLTIGRAVRGAERLVAIQDALLAFVAPWGPMEATCIEGCSYGSEHREYDLGEGSGALKIAMYRMSGNEPLVIEPTRLKLFATGDGGAEKTEVMQYVVRRHGEVDGDDAADAVVLAIIVHALRYKVRCETRAQAEVLFALRNDKPRAKKRSRGSKTPNI